MPASSEPPTQRQPDTVAEPLSNLDTLDTLSDIDMAPVRTEYKETPVSLPEFEPRTRETHPKQAKLPSLGHPQVDESQKQLMHAVSYMKAEARQDVLQACKVGNAAHHGVTRKSGEPYITHPIAVAEILAGFRLDRDTIIAAILHDTIEDTSITYDEVAEQFGDSVARLVDGVTKLKSSSQNKEQNKAATFHKIIAATLDDPRVLIIKLADRLHNMSTLGAVRAEKRRATALETMQFYVPFARLMGLNEIADYIEVLCYRNLDESMYAELSDKLLQHGLGRQMHTNSILNYLTRLIDRLQVSGHVRVLNNQAMMYRQFFRSRGDINALLRHYAFEIVVSSIADCDLLAEHLINKYDIPAKQVSDNIRHPLPGGNQSLTLTYHDDNDEIVVTLLTQQMQETAKLGVIASQEASDLSRSVIQASLNNMKELLEQENDEGTMSSNETNFAGIDETKNTESLVATTERLLSYFNARKIVCYSPKGKAYELPRGATALDFAYAVGPKVGHVATGAMIDGEPAKLGSVLHSGQTVEIETDATATPRAEWLGIVATNKARKELQRWLNHLPADEQLRYGEQSLNRALKTYDKSLSDITESDWEDLLTWQNVENKVALFTKISQGILLPQLVVSRLFSDDVAKQQADAENQGFEKAHQMLKNANGVEVHFAGCCYPIFGDPIIGHLTRHGLVVHRHQCYSVKEKQQSLTYEFVQLGWHSEAQVQKSIPHARKRPHFTAYFYVGLALNDEQVSQLVHTLRQQHIGIEKINVQEKESITTLKVIVRSRQHLEEGMSALRPHFDFCVIKRMYRDHIFETSPQDERHDKPVMS